MLETLLVCLKKWVKLMNFDLSEVFNFSSQSTKIVSKGLLRFLQNRDYLEQILLKSSKFVFLEFIFS